MDLPLGVTVLGLALFCGGVTLAQEVVPRRVAAHEAAQWRGVGSLRVAGHQSCTAVLISDREAITAAHCVVDRTTGKRVVPALYRLVLGQRSDGFAAVRGVRATAFLPGFVNDLPTIDITTLSTDLALLALDSPVLPTEAAPVELADWPKPMGGHVDIVGYERGGALDATIREGCPALHSMSGVTALGCDVITGISGSPVLLRGEPGDAPRLVASVSSRGQEGALVVTIAPHLPLLRRLIK